MTVSRTVRVVAVLALASAVLGGGPPLAAQTIQGRVLDDQDDRPIVTALVRLVDAQGEPRGVSAADSSGFFRIVAPGPGVYRLQAERLGYDGFETPLLETQNPEGVYPIDLLMHRAPIPIQGLQVSTERAERELRLMIGMNPRSLRRAPLFWEEIQGHIERAHDLSAMMRWQNAGGLIVYETTEGPCFSVRARGCLAIYLNSMVLNPLFTDVVPLDMLYSVVILYPNETITYPQGAVLLYTEAWLR